MARELPHPCSGRAAPMLGELVVDAGAGADTIVEDGGRTVELPA